MESNDTEQIKLSLKEWGDLILVEPKGKGRSRHYSAICPICLTGYEVDILSADTSARTFAVEAVEKVISHIKTAHCDALIGWRNASFTAGDIPLCDQNRK